MTPEQFCYWLQGRAELRPDKVPSKREWDMIVEHLQTVFDKQTTTTWAYPVINTDTFPKPDPTKGWEITCSDPMKKPLCSSQ